MPTALQMPFRDRPAEQVGRRVFRKQILPVDRIDYHGRVLDFTPDVLRALARNFTAGRVDQVPFVLADPENRHNSDPERFRGEVKGLEVQPDGLYAVVETTDAGARALIDNPRLGVSARIIPDSPHGPTIEHICGTLNPHIKGMGDWTPADLSASAGQVIDLTDRVYSRDMADELTLTADEIRAFRDLLTRRAEQQPGGENPVPPPAAPPADPPAARSDDGHPDLRAEVDALLADIHAHGDAEEPAAEPVGLTADARAAIDLARQQAQDARDDALRLRQEAARTRWQTSRAAYAAAGVPPVLLDLAAPILQHPEAVIDLTATGGERIDAHQTIRGILDAARGTVDFTERGHTEGEDERAEARRLAQAWRDS